MNASQYLYYCLKNYDEDLWVAIAVGQVGLSDSNARNEFRQALEAAHWANVAAKRLISDVGSLTEQGFGSAEDTLAYLDEMRVSEAMLEESIGP